MAQDNKKKRGRNSGMSVLLMLLLILVGAAGAAGTVYVLGKDKLFGGSKPVQARERNEADHTGKVAVPICARTIDAYAAVQNDDLIDPRVKDFAVRWIDADKAKQSNFLTDLNTIRGRVLAREKHAGYAFEERDFLPVGTRPGPAAAIEKGTRGVWVEADQVQGLSDLRRGDRFDVMATVKLSSSGLSTADARLLSPEAQAAQADGKAWKTSKRLLVNDGKVVMPLPADPAQRKGKKVFVQVAELEVEPLSDALAVHAELVCYLRSGQPGAGDSSLPAPERPAAMDTIEIMQGGKTTTIQVPGGAKSDEDEEPK